MAAEAVQGNLAVVVYGESDGGVRAGQAGGRGGAGAEQYAAVAQLPPPDPYCVGQALSQARYVIYIYRLCIRTL